MAVSSTNGKTIPAEVEEAALKGPPAASKRALVRLDGARANLVEERYGGGPSARLSRPWRVAKLYENGCLLTLILRQQSSILEQGRMLAEWAEPWGWRSLAEFRAELVRLAAQQPRLGAWMRAGTRSAARGQGPEEI